MKKILITGASGFIGSFLVDEALRNNYEVFAGIRNSSSKLFLTDERINFFEIDFSDPEKMKKQFSDFKNEQGVFDYVIHSAGITKAIKKKEYFTINYSYTINFANALIQSHCVPQKFLFISSLAAYGPGTGTSPVKFSDLPQPVTAYGRSKLSVEQDLSSQNYFPFMIMRPTAVYGPRDTGLYVLMKIINNGIEPYIGYGKQLLSFVYVRDLAKTVFTALESPFQNRSYFISDGNEYTIQDFNKIIRKYLQKKTFRLTIPSVLASPVAMASELVASLCGKPAAFNRERLKEYSAPNWLCDIEPLKKDLNFIPEYNLDTGLCETIEWYKQNCWL